MPSDLPDSLGFHVFYVLSVICGKQYTQFSGNLYDILIDTAVPCQLYVWCDAAFI
jgi:hypothetical protein